MLSVHVVGGTPSNLWRVDKSQFEPHTVSRGNWFDVGRYNLRDKVVADLPAAAIFRRLVRPAHL